MDKAKSSERRGLSKSKSHHSLHCGLDEEIMQNTINGHNNDGALEALMATSRESCKKSTNAPKSQPLRKCRRSLLQTFKHPSFKHQAQSSTSVSQDSQRKADEILLSLTSTPTSRPKRKAGSKLMSDEMWALVSSHHHNSMHLKDSTTDQESSHSLRSSVHSFAEDSDNPEEDNLVQRIATQDKMLQSPSFNGSPVGRRGRASRHLRLPNGSHKAQLAVPLAGSKTSASRASSGRRNRRQELSKSCSAKNIEEEPVSPPSEERKSSEMALEDPSTASEVLLAQPTTLHSIPQSPAGRRSPARVTPSAVPKSRSNSASRRKDSRRTRNSDSSSASRRILEKYSGPQRRSSIGPTGHRRPSYRLGPEESLQNREIVKQSLKRVSSVTSLDEQRRSRQQTIASPSSPVSRRRSLAGKSAAGISSAEEVNSTSGRNRRPKVARSAHSRKHVG